MAADPSAPITDFNQATAVTPDPADPSVFRAELRSEWRFGPGINGGTLMATAGRALSESLGSPANHRDPFAITAYFVSAAVPGPASVYVTPLKTGRSTSTVAARFAQPAQDGTETDRFHVLATYGNLDSLGDEVHTSANPPSLPPPDQCVRATEVMPDFYLDAVPIMGQVDLRLDPATTGWTAGNPSGTGMARGWLRMPDGHAPDPLLLLMAVDLLPPVSFDLGVYAPAPTVELTVHVRANPARGWLRLTHSTRNYACGYLEEDAEVWDSNDRLVAQSRQLAVVRKPRG